MSVTVILSAERTIYSAGSDLYVNLRRHDKTWGTRPGGLNRVQGGARGVCAGVDEWLKYTGWAKKLTHFLVYLSCLILNNFNICY